MIESHMKRLTGDTVTFPQFRQILMQGGANARRVVLWHLRTLDHPTTRLDDIDPAEDELTVDLSKSELAELREVIARNNGLEQHTKDLMLGEIDSQMETAQDDGGKAPSSPSGTDTD